MKGGILLSRYKSKEPVVDTWLNALTDTRKRTQDTLEGINPWDAIVDLLRDKHKLLIGTRTAENVMIEIGYIPLKQYATTTVKGRSLVNGLPATIEISSIELQEADNSQATLPYVEWAAEVGDSTIGLLLYSIAANEANWLYRGVLQHVPPAHIERLFERNPNKLAAFLRGETIAQHWKRLQMVREELALAFQEMPLEDFQRTRMGRDMWCSAEWILHELCQFEAERRAELAVVYAAAKIALMPKSSE